MSPAKLEILIQSAARWLYEKEHEHGKNGELWLTPAVLTASNPDKSNPQFSLPDAVVAFAHLFKRGLLTPTHVTLKDDGGNTHFVSAYFVNHAQDAAWKELTSKTGWWKLTFLPIARWLFGKRPAFWALMLFLLGAIATALLTSITEDLYKKHLQPYIKPAAVNAGN